VQQKLVDNAHPGVNNTVAAEICICCGCFVRVHNINFNPLNLKVNPFLQKNYFRLIITCSMVILLTHNNL
jgi:hypothetical protein